MIDADQQQADIRDALNRLNAAASGYDRAANAYEQIATFSPGEAEAIQAAAAELGQMHAWHTIARSFVRALHEYHREPNDPQRWHHLRAIDSALLTAEGKHDPELSGPGQPRQRRPLAIHYQTCPAASHTGRCQCCEIGARAH